MRRHISQDRLDRAAWHGPREVAVELYFRQFIAKILEKRQCAHLNKHTNIRRMPAVVDSNNSGYTIKTLTATDDTCRSLSDIAVAPTDHLIICRVTKSKKCFPFTLEHVENYFVAGW